MRTAAIASSVLVAALVVAALALIFSVLARSRRDCVAEGVGWFFQGRRGKGGKAGGRDDAVADGGPVLPSRPLRNALRNAAHSGDMATVRDILERGSRRFQGFQHWGQLTCQDLREAFQRAWRRGHHTLAHYLHRRRLTHGCSYGHVPNYNDLYYTHPLRPYRLNSLTPSRHRRASTLSTPFRRYRRWRRRHPFHYT